MGWFDDNHWAGEAYDFGMGYMARAGFMPEAGLSDTDDSDGSDVDELLRCRGRTKAGRRCKVTVESLHGGGRSIMRLGYCAKHLGQSPSGTARSTPKPIVRPQSDPPLVAAARSGDLAQVRCLVSTGLANDAVLQNNQVDLEVVGAGGDTAVIAAARNGHHEALLELLCAGASPKLLQHGTQQAIWAVNLAQREVQASIDTGLPLASAKLTLELKARLLLCKTLLEAALQDWPVPQLPALPAEPKCPEATSFSVVQLKDILRRHGARVSGRKADLVERVDGLNLAERVEGESIQLQKLQEERDAVLRKRDDIARVLDTRASRLRKVMIESAPHAPTEAEIESVVKKGSAVPAGTSEQQPLGQPRGMLNQLLSKPPTSHLGRAAYSQLLLDRDRLMSQSPNMVASGGRPGLVYSRSDRSRSPRRPSVASKITCKHFAQGRCRFGFRCRHLHDAETGMALPRSGLEPICCYLLQGKCRFGAMCDFSHEKPDEKRACHFGSSCWLGHK